MAGGGGDFLRHYTCGQLHIGGGKCGVSITSRKCIVM